MQPVAYIYNDQISKFIFSQDHPMKPKRMKMAHSLIQNFKLTRSMKMFHGRTATKEEICQFHHPDYIEYLENWVSPSSKSIVKQYYSGSNKGKQGETQKLNEMYKINRSFDCPSFEGLYDFCELAIGNSLDAADLIITGEAKTAINWSGGYHHAKKSEASGFCYVNDIVVCILELLKVYPRVLYLDIDVHHGDGVQEAFYHTNRVLTVSFHQYEDNFFPGTGEVESVGDGLGKYYSVNVPLRKGIDDMSYLDIFKKITNITMNSYQPDVVVFQSGADSLSKDRIGNFEMSIRGYGQCVKHMKSFNVPMILLGGGGYTIENVARCWAYQTAVVLNLDIGNQIPENNQFYSYYKDDNYKLHFEPKLGQNLNQQKDLDHLVQVITQNMRDAQIRPSVAFHHAPKNFLPVSEMQWRAIEQQQNSMYDSQMPKFLR